MPTTEASKTACSTEEEKSWFSVNRKCFNNEDRNVSLCFSSEHNDSTITNTKMKRVRIYPTQEEKDKLKLMFRAFRWSYNATVAIVNCYKETNEFKEILSHKSVSYMSLRTQLCSYKYIEETKSFGEGGFSFPSPLWMKDIHSRIPRGAIKSYTGNLNSAITNQRNGNIKNYELKFKTKKHSLTEECLFEDKQYPFWINKIRGIYRKGRRNKTLWKDIEHSKGLTVLRDRITNKYYLLLPVSITSIKMEDNENQGIVSLDVGVRTFQTAYSPKGEIIDIGKDSYLHLKKLLKRTDFLAKKYKENRVRKWKIKRLKLFQRIRNLVNELHWKTISFLTSNYKTILYPDFRIGGMIKKKSSVLSRMNKRLLITLSFFKFKTRLLYKAGTLGVRVIIVNESYTSKTCGGCGWQNEQLGKSKMFECKECGLVIDRDYNGARNILLKHST